MDDAARERYRARVWHDNPMSRLVEQHRVIEGLLAEAADLDARLTRVVRSLDPADYRAFSEVLGLPHLKVWLGTKKADASDLTPGKLSELADKSAANT